MSVRTETIRCYVLISIFASVGNYLQNKNRIHTYDVSMCYMRKTSYKEIFLCIRYSNMNNALKH